jgi:hypothetical protein
VALFGWLKKVGPRPPDPSAWEIRRESVRMVVSDGKKEFAFEPNRESTVRLVPLGAGGAHGTASGAGWQVAVHSSLGDVPIGPPLADWRAAFTFARRLCTTAGISLDEMTERMFSQLDVADAPVERAS